VEQPAKKEGTKKRRTVPDAVTYSKFKLTLPTAETSGDDPAPQIEKDHPSPPHTQVTPAPG